MKSMNRSFTQAEEKQLFATLRKFKDVEAERDLYWMMLARYTGRRIETIFKMDVDRAIAAVDKGYLDISSDMQKGGKADAVHALDQSQSVFLVAKSKDALLGLLKARKAMIKRASGEPNDANALILSRTGNRLSIRSMQHRMKFWCKQAGIVEATPHWWRHTWAVRRLQNASCNNEKALREVQSVLGHRHITTTQIYTAPNRDDLKQSMLEAAL